MNRKIKAFAGFLRRKGIVETFRKTYCTLAKKPYLHKVPFYIHIELNNTCNFRCHMCPIHKMKRPVRLMDFPMYKKIIDECSSAGIWRVRLFLMVEPLLHPKLIEYIEYAKEKGLYVDFDSNGGFLDKIDQERLIKSGVDSIVFSVTGSRPETYRRFQGEDLDRIEKNIRGFISLRDCLGMKKPEISMQFIKSSDTENEISEYVRKWDSISDNINITGLSDYYDPKDKSSRKKRFCPFLWTYLVVLSDGTIVPCCQDYEGKLSLGNINETSLLTAWRSEKLLHLRKLHENREGDKIGLCKDCDVMYF